MALLAELPDTDMDDDPSPPSLPLPNPSEPRDKPIFLRPENNLSANQCRNNAHATTTRIDPAATKVTSSQRPPTTPVNSLLCPNELACSNGLTLASSCHDPKSLWKFKPDMRHSTPVYPGSSRRAELVKLANDNAHPAIGVGAKHHKGNANQSIDPPP
ncbi:Protein of unknown function [Pyronema omphalodes CBS 100304]|uniref:Uncharacterized protein n=1 Tax=Pyronema omphalodes (strain CBS 100304) TaxID=1076935 RepID=U4LGN0_PYROM|nr:Protein of unknown function [Pyronema omphalodes CBS 100304]